MRNPPDYTVCKKKKSDAEKTIADYPFMEKLERGPRNKIMFEMLDPSHDKWTHKYFGSSSRKRENIE